MNENILLIEDDKSICIMVKDYLIKEGFSVSAAYDGSEAVSAYFRDSFHLVILDLMIPKMDGMEVLRLIREKSTVPILIMSARDGDTDKAVGLGLGADDYITKPFSLVELTARVKALIRRSTRYAAPEKALDQVPPICFRKLVVDMNNFMVTKNGEDVKLTLKEFEILKLFLTYPNRVFTKGQLYSLVWNEDYLGDENVINVHMRRLRQKIEDDPSKPHYIKTLWGIGYKLGEPE